jgi:hypothetical protein
MSPTMIVWHICNHSKKAMADIIENFTQKPDCGAYLQLKFTSCSHGVAWHWYAAAGRESKPTPADGINFFESLLYKGKRPSKGWFGDIP